MMPVIQRRVHALYRCFTHRHRIIVISPTEGTVFHPPEPTENSIMALVCKTVTRARVFNFKKSF